MAGKAGVEASSPRYVESLPQGVKPLPRAGWMPDRNEAMIGVMSTAAAIVLGAIGGVFSHNGWVALGILVITGVLVGRGLGRRVLAAYVGTLVLTALVLFLGVLVLFSMIIY